MKRLLLILPLLAFLFFSCENKEEESEYVNWQARNEAYVDSIARLAKNGTDGWKRVLAYNVMQGYADANPTDNNVYVYMKQDTSKHATGTEFPAFTDSVRCYYKGRLIPQTSYPEGKIFDGCYTGNAPDLQTDVPSLFRVSGLVVGFSTAVQTMREGESYKVIIPANLGYGTASSNGIPAYSALNFDIMLSKIYKRGENATWY